MEPRKKTKYPTSAQKARLIDLLKADSQFENGKFTFTRKIEFTRWRHIQEQLNSIPGAKKTWKEWRKTWTDMKTKRKKRLALLAKQTGGVTDPLNFEVPCLSKNEYIMVNNDNDDIQQSETPYYESNGDHCYMPLQHTIETEQMPEEESSSPVILKTLTRKCIKRPIKTENVQEEESKVCKECSEHNEHDDRNQIFSEMIARELKYVKPCVRTKCYIDILAFLQAAKGLHIEEIDKSPV